MKILKKIWGMLCAIILIGGYFFFWSKKKQVRYDVDNLKKSAEELKRLDAEVKRSAALDQAYVKKVNNLHKKKREMRVKAAKIRQKIKDMDDEDISAELDNLLNSI